ncbi:fumarylacetoacetate hydrolase [Roseovarius litoreus]|uniref:fumarylacetoacetase n=1 Tax=Roseovarius litoreus TaxID=1155722 RepID=A0A1M7JEA7_9RHOB|nr:fumarylacetoacetase [Roseovarius litoreus]SHM51430.1 fumarylacetoacetate hydrolase [Roseovarius litoreus]
MSQKPDQTTDLNLASWVESANAERCDFPIQNLPYGIFRRAGSGDAFRVGVAIGEMILDMQAGLAAGAFAGLDAESRAALGQPLLNDVMALDVSQRRALRAALSEALREGASEAAVLEPCLVPQAEAEYAMPAHVGDFSDFYSSLYHATNVGAQFRPNNPILPNFRYIPVAYDARASAVAVSGAPLVRPSGQLKFDAAEPVFAPCRMLDYEAELGIFLAAPKEGVTRVSMEEVEDSVFGLCVLNDWTARDIQRWEYQPLGPFLSKSFRTTLSPWVVSLDALQPFRAPFTRPEGEPALLPHLNRADLRSRGQIDVKLEVTLQTAQMRAAGEAPTVLSTSTLKDAYWTIWQLVVHQTSNGCPILPGDLLGSGTLSGPTENSLACLLEKSRAGKAPFTLPNGEPRTFLEDGDLVTIRGYCADGERYIGLGSAEGLVQPAIEA